MAALGVLVLIGWHTNTPALIQVRPGFNPTAYNTALGLVLCGGGVALAATGRMRAAALCGALPAALGLLTVIQHAFGFSLHLDTVFFQAYAGSTLNDPTAVALNTGLCFLLAGTGLMSMARRPCTELCLMAKGVLGSVLFAVAATASFGYLAGIPTAYGWLGLTQMAAPTAMAFLLLSLGMLAFAWSEGLALSSDPPGWLGVLAGVWVLLVAVQLFQALRTEEDASVTLTTELVTSSVTNEVSRVVNDRLMELARLARHWELQGPPERMAWQAEAALLVRHMSEMRAVAWVNNSLQTRWVALADQTMDGDEISALADRYHQELAAARDRREVRLTEFIPLPEGGTAFLACAPIYRAHQFEGIILGLFHTERLLNPLLKNVAPRHSVLLLDGGKTIYRQFEPVDGPNAAWRREPRLSFQNARWRFRVAPTAEFLNEVKSGLPGVVLGAGVMMAVLLGGLVSFYQTARRQRRQIQKANDQLELDITERKQAAAERERLIRELQDALANVKTLHGLLPICAGCKKIRDDKGYWNQIEAYISRHSDAKFSHGFCPDCVKKYYPDLDL